VRLSSAFIATYSLVYIKKKLISIGAKGGKPFFILFSGHGYMTKGGYKNVAEEFLK
jgi:hypothetical protein